MMTDAERQDVKKSMGFDLLMLLKAEPNKVYTAQEIEALIIAYLTGTNAS